MERCKGYPVNPKIIGLAIIKKCNFKCVFCGAYNINKNVKPMTDGMVDKCLDAYPTVMAARIGARGDALMHKNLFGLVRRLVSRNVAVTVSTNGSKIATTGSNADWALFKGVNVSLLATNKEEHKALVGVDRFDDVLAGIERLRSAGVKFNTSYVITRENIERIPEYAEFSSALGAHAVIMTPVQGYGGVEVGDEEAIRRFREEQAFTVERKDIVDRLRVAREKTSVRAEVQFPAVVDFSRPVRQCIRVSRRLEVDSDGNLGACCRGPGARPELGNIADGVSWNHGPLGKRRKAILGPPEGRPRKCLGCWANYETMRP